MVHTGLVTVHWMTVTEAAVPGTATRWWLFNGHKHAWRIWIFVLMVRLYDQLHQWIPHWTTFQAPSIYRWWVSMEHVHSLVSFSWIVSLSVASQEHSQFLMPHSRKFHLSIWIPRKPRLGCSGVSWNGKPCYQATYWRPLSAFIAELQLLIRQHVW